jgi:hypothetical protein
MKVARVAVESTFFLPISNHQKYLLGIVGETENGG